jgi:hypothetical protein
MCTQSTAAGVLLVMITALGAANASAQSNTTPVRDVAAELACGARAVLEKPTSTIRVVKSNDTEKQLMGPGEAIIINAGTDHGIKVGDEFFVRRVIQDRFTAKSAGQQTISIHTAGWVRIVDVGTTAAVAKLTRTCDGVQIDDYLEPFALPVMATQNDTKGEPDYARPGHVILGDDRRQMGAEGSLMVFDRGTDHGVKPGHTLTIFRNTIAGGPVLKVAQAMVVVADPEMSLIRILKSSESVYVGDLVAIHR